MKMFLIEKIFMILISHCVELDFDDGNGSVCIICYVEVIIINLLHATRLHGTNWL